MKHECLEHALALRKQKKGTPNSIVIAVNCYIIFNSVCVLLTVK
jgi:hypothetical protein